MRELTIGMGAILVFFMSSVTGKLNANLRTQPQQQERILKIAKEEAIRFSYNRDYIAVVDWSLTADRHRFFLVSLKNSKIVYSWFTSHGKNTGSRKKATSFSNVKGSHKSSLGVIRVSETYIGKYGYSVRLDGLEHSNSNIRDRVIVLHPADYVEHRYILKNKYSGRSLGCFTLEKAKSRWVIDKLKNGGLIISTK